jgi:aspartate aminotransferase
LKFAKRLDPIKPSATLAVTSKAKALKAAGHDVLSFAAGEPDFPTPDFVVQAMVDSAKNGATRYLPSLGLPALRSAVATAFTALYDVDFGPDNIAVTCGGKHGLYNLFQALVDPGDEVLVASPCWVSYPAQVQLAGGHPVIVPTQADEGFRWDAQDVAKAITPKTVGLVINSPSNPSGAVYDRETLNKLADLAVEHDLWIITDDIYSHITYDNVPFESVLRNRPELRDRIFVIHGASKTYSMTGWRIGFVAAPTPVIKKLGILQGQSTSNATAFAQYGALAAIESDHGFLVEWLAAYDARRKRITALLNDIPGVHCDLPGGAFYVFPDLRGLMGKSYKGEVIRDDLHLADVVLEHKLVALVPGSAFGTFGFVRMSYACSMDDIERGLERFKEFVSELE